MIVRSYARPITYDDIEVGSIVTIVNEKNEWLKYMVLRYRKGKKKPCIWGLRIVTVDSAGKYAYYLYSNQVVLLNEISTFKVGCVQIVQARLAKDIVDSVLKAVKDYQEQEELRKREAGNVQVDSSVIPKGYANTDWGALKNATKGYIRIYRG